jgi:dihydropteroate synthase
MNVKVRSKQNEANPSGEQSSNCVTQLRLRDRTFTWGTRTYIMGVVNVTPDSFSNDGVLHPELAAERARQHVVNGADIVDFGGQSTRPGHQPVSVQEQYERVIPAIKQFRAASNAVVSIDTFEPSILSQALREGADIANSIWGITDELLDVLLEHKAPIVVMHNSSEPVYPSGVMEHVLHYLDRAASQAVRAGLAESSIILDPGIGFGKTADHNLEILGALERIVALGFPTLVGTSRKSTIGKLTDKPVTERQFGTAATVALAIAAGVDIVRVHDVAEMADVVKVSDALVRGWRPEGWTV